MSSFYTCPKDDDQMMYGTRDMVRDRWTDGQMNRKKWHRKVGAPPIKINISNRVQLSLG